MLEAPKIIQTETLPTAVIHLRIPKADIQRVMGPGIAELMATIAAQGIPPTGPWFTHHLTMADDKWDFEISVPVSAPVTAAGRVKPSQWPGMKVAETVYRGPYEGLGEAWGEFMDWIAANAHSPAEDLYETYLVGPESEDEPANWRTKLTRPLKS